MQKEKALILNLNWNAFINSEKQQQKIFSSKSYEKMGRRSNFFSDGLLEEMQTTT